MERRRDLRCRGDCPFKQKFSLRPCVDKVREHEQYCEEEIDFAIASRGVENPDLSILEKRIEVFQNGEKAGIIANGVLVMLRDFD